MKQRQGRHGWLRFPGLLNPFSGSFKACFRQQLRAPAWDGGEKVGLVSTASGANPKFESDEMHAAESFWNRFWGNGKGTFHLVPASSHISMLTLLLLDLTRVRPHFTLQCLSSLSCDLTRAKEAPANTALVPCRAKKKCVPSDPWVCDMEREAGSCPVWGSQCFQGRRVK